MFDHFMSHLLIVENFMSHLLSNLLIVENFLIKQFFHNYLMSYMTLNNQTRFF